ncbi:hypothetical protein [Streptodolium elevatio]|uniref:EspG family protein n=1 Tax=Streptodolium elevatio TaxID=3157996 RepID=A0ABV3D8R7_9ACTN
MNASASGSEEFAYLAPLFQAAAAHRTGDVIIPLPPPEAGSSLAADDGPLKSWGTAGWVRCLLPAGLLHVEVLRTLVADVRRVDPFTPWTLLRAAVEDFATAVWLLDGPTRKVRQHRALRLWAEDFRNRAQHEDDTGHTPEGSAKSGTERREEVQHLADMLGLRALARPHVTEIISDAAPVVGLDPRQARASWRVASGFAHGRRWTPLRAAAPNEIIATGEDRLVAFVIDDAELDSLASVCRTFLEHAAQRYTARGTAL